MEMNEKKVISEVEEVVKPMSQLSIDEIKTLPIYDLRLVRNHNRKTNRTSYYYLFNLGGLNISDRLEESEYKLILLKKKVLEEKDELTIKSFVRFVKGKTSTDKDYYMVQIFFVSDVFKSKFLSKSEAILLNEYNKMGRLDKKINWLISSVVADDNNVLGEDEVLGF